MFNQQGFTLIELVSVMVIMSVLASVTVQKFQLISDNAETRALESAQTELNVRETMTWANIKLSNAGWTDDSDVFKHVDANLEQGYYWDPEPTISGGTLYFRQNSIILKRKASATSYAGRWQ